MTTHCDSLSQNTSLEWVHYRCLLLKRVTNANLQKQKKTVQLPYRAVRYPFFTAAAVALAVDLTLHMFHPFQQSNHLQTLATTYATKHLHKEP
jgi:hypothetical protein